MGFWGFGVLGFMIRGIVMGFYRFQGFERVVQATVRGP